MQPVHPLLSLPTIFPAPLQHLQQLCLSTASPPAKPRVRHLPALSLPNHSLSPPPQNHEVGGGAGGGTEALPQRPEARGQESGASDHLTGLQPRRDAVWGVEWGEGWGGVGSEVPCGGGGEKRDWGSRVGGREERNDAENEGPVPDASLWLPQPPAGQDQSIGTGGPREDPALSPFPALPSKDSELPALLFTSHRCGQ